MGSNPIVASWETKFITDVTEWQNGALNLWAPFWLSGLQTVAISGIDGIICTYKSFFIEGKLSSVFRLRSEPFTCTSILTMKVKNARISKSIPVIIPSIQLSKHSSPLPPTTSHPGRLKSYQGSSGLAHAAQKNLSWVSWLDGSFRRFGLDLRTLLWHFLMRNMGGSWFTSSCLLTWE